MDLTASKQPEKTYTRKRRSKNDEVEQPSKRSKNGNENKSKADEMVLQDEIEEHPAVNKKKGQPSKKKSKTDRNKDAELVVQDEEVEQPEVKKKKVQPFQTKCRPLKLVELIANLNEEQRKAVSDVGFGGLLELKLTKIPHGILKMLLKAFDHTSNMFKTKKFDFLLTKDDVHDIFQLPRQGGKVDVAHMGNTTAVTDTKLKNAWRAKFGLESTSAPIMVKDVHDRLMECNDAGDEFKRMFVIYSMSIFLAPSSNKSLDLKLVKAVEHVTRISQFDWCEYVFEEMVRSVRVFKEGGKSTVSGCVIVIMLAYMHRFDFKGDVLEHTLPLIQHWDDKKLSKRVDDEKKTGSLGNAPISKIQYPICQQQEVPKKTPYSSAAPEILLTQTSDHEAEVETKEGYMMVKLPSGVETDEQIRARAMDRAHEIYLRMKRDNELFIGRYVRNMRKLITMKAKSSMDEATTSTQSGAKVDGAEEEIGNPEKSTTETQTLPFMKDVGYHNLVDMLIARSYEVKKAKEGMPAFDVWTEMLKVQYKELNTKYGGCTDKDLQNSDDDLECDDKQQDDDINDVTNLDSGDDEDEDDGLDNDMNSKLNDVISSIGVGVGSPVEELNRDTLNEEDGEKQCGKINEETDVLTQLDEGVINVGLGGTKTGEKVQEMNEESGKEAGEKNDEKSVGSHKKEVLPNVQLETERTWSINDYLLHADSMNKIPESADMVPHNLGCTMDCGLPDRDAALVSDFMFRQDQLFETVLKRRKEVMDYCFLTDHAIKKTEIVCDFGIYHNIPKSDIESLLPDTKIEAVVIEAWAILLNEFEMAPKDSNRPTRIFYGLAHSGGMEKLLLVDEENVDELTRLKEDVWRTWDTWSNQYKQPLNLNSDMVFIPLLYQDHYICVCIDSKREKMFYLDNRDYDHFEDEEHVHLAHLTGAVYGHYLNSKGYASGAKVQDYVLTNVAFDWQTKELNLDCGLFMMFHMMFFVGEDFKCELNDQKKRQLYRGEIAATLVLSDLNKCRSQVLRKVTNLNAIKGTLLPKLVAKRKAASKRKRGKGGKKNVQTPVQKKTGVVEDGSASVVGSSRRGKSDGLGSTYNCGVADSNVEVVSRFMKANKSLCAKMLTMRKQVLDYCLLDDHSFPLDEVVAKFSNDQYLVRNDILSLLPNEHVSSNVIECWSLILNHIEHTEKCETSLMFFGIRHMEIKTEGAGDRELVKEKMFEEWDEFIRRNTVPCNLQADLVFIPMVWKEHYFCVCINFKTETVEVLDNTEYADWEQTQIHKVADLVAEHMSDYLAKKNVERADDIITFDVVNINFPWQKTEMNNTESGNFLMMHMIRYEGVMFEADLNQKVYRRYYWLEMAAALLLADINENRTPLIEKVKEFSDGKDEIWKTLKQQRKNNEKAKGKHQVEVPMAEVQTKENAEVVVEETNKEDVPETAKEDCTKKPIINTELPILRQSPRKRGADPGKDGEDRTYEPTRTYKRGRIKTVANPKNRGRGRG